MKAPVKQQARPVGLMAAAQLEYALYINGVFREVRKFSNTPEDLPNKGVKWYPVVRNARPDYDAATHIAEPDNSLVDGIYTFGWNVRALTQSEIDKRNQDDADAVNSAIQSELESAVGKVLFKIVNEIRVLQSQPKLTPAQFKTWWRNNRS